MTHRGPFQHLTFCDSVTFSPHHSVYTQEQGPARWGAESQTLHIF